MRDFAKGGQVAVKMGNMVGVELENQFVSTTIIDPKNIEPADLINSPCLFQEYIPKDHELRVYVIGNEVYACKIESQTSKKTKVDWRNYDLSNTPHLPIEIIQETKQKCIKLVESLGLNMGALDLIVTPDGETVFLECNSEGSWLWIEELSGLPITEAVCRFLLS